MTIAKIKSSFSRGSVVATVLTYAVLMIAGDALVMVPQASAAQLQTRSLQVSSSANGTITTDASGNAAAAGSGGNGAKTSETFTFTPSGGTVGSIEFLYCTTPLPADTCTAPTGLDVSTVSSVGGTSGTGWTVGANTVNKVQITHTAATFIGAKNFILGTGSTGTDYIKNPTTDNQTFFVRITTYSATNYTGAVDQGTVASSTAQQVDVTAKVQETLGFSVGVPAYAAGVEQAPNAEDASCTLNDANNGALPLGDPNGVLSSNTAYTAHSYFRMYTNATNGAVVSYSGNTLKNGAKIIDAINSNANPGTSPGTAASSGVGTNQFGVAVDQGDASGDVIATPATNHYTTPSGAYASDLTNAPATASNKWAFNTTSITTPIQIASSPGIVKCDTASVSYLGNIAATTPAGIYTTTITYIATPTY